jgi:hypothetical protein
MHRAIPRTVGRLGQGEEKRGEGRGGEGSSGGMRSSLLSWLSARSSSEVHLALL